MADKKTFTMIKPSAFRSGYTGPILSRIEEAGFSIRALKMVQLTRNQAEHFYEMHKGKSFYDHLIEFMTSGPVIAAVLEKENAVEEFRKLIGATDPSKSESGTLRNLYGKSLTENAIHGSDGDESAERECNIFFSFLETN